MGPLTAPATYDAQTATYTHDAAGSVTGLRVTVITVSCPLRSMILRSDGHGEF